jgi:hypothetical protein
MSRHRIFYLFCSAGESMEQVPSYETAKIGYMELLLQKWVHLKV